MPNNTLPLLVALTGGIGCGKTTVLDQFRSIGIPCFIADQVAGAYYQDPAFLASIRHLFGNSVFRPDGTADKAAIARIVFADTDKLAKLNSLVHPRVWDDFQRFAASHAASPYLIFESAIIYEAHLDRLVDKVVCVYLSLDERIARLTVRDHATAEQIHSRIRRQLPAEEVMQRADHVILNYEGNPRTRQVQHIHNQLLAAAEKSKIIWGCVDS